MSQGKWMECYIDGAVCESCGYTTLHTAARLNELHCPGCGRKGDRGMFHDWWIIKPIRMNKFVWWNPSTWRRSYQWWIELDQAEVVSKD